MYYVYIEANVCNMMGDTSPMPTAHSDPFAIFKFGKSDHLKNFYVHSIFIKNVTCIS